MLLLQRTKLQFISQNLVGQWTATRICRFRASNATFCPPKTHTHMWPQIQRYRKMNKSVFKVNFKEASRKGFIWGIDSDIPWNVVPIRIFY